MSRTYSHCSSDVFIHYLMEYTHTQDKELLQLLKQAKGKSNQIIDRLRREQQRNKLKKETYCNTLYKYIIIHYCHVLHHILSHIFSIIYIFVSTYCYIGPLSVLNFFVLKWNSQGVPVYLPHHFRHHFV